MYPVMDYLTSAEMLLFFGIASGVLSTIAFVPYILDTISRQTEPQRASWLIWSVLGSIAFGSQVFEGATSSLWFAGVQVSGTIIVFVLSIRVGTGKFLSKSDHLILFFASIGLLLWYLTDNAAYALAITISISLLGGMATVVKAYRDPESETLVTWVVSFVASICAMLSVGAVDLTLLAYPLYLFTLYLAFIVAIVLGRVRDRTADNGTVPSARPFSLSVLFSGLRTTADAVIVSVAFVFAFNWVGANSSAVGVASVSAGRQAMDGVRAYRQENSVEPVAVFSISGPGGATVAGGYKLAGDYENATRVVVVAVDSASDLAASAESIPTILRDIGVLSDATIVQNTDLIVPVSARDVPVRDVPVRDVPVRDVPGTDAETSILISASDLRVADVTAATVASAEVPPPVNSLSVDLPLPDGVIAVDASSMPNHPPNHLPNNLANDLTNDFLLLDADDPFAMLVVVSDTAMLTVEVDSTLPQSQLQRGERLLALATNGEWFRVQLSGGLEGYVHHSQVSVEALSSLHANRAG